jgi:oxygen-independent coproporphyrinogen-3 oxidase
MKPFSIYLHIPFCSHKCPYCDFNTYAVTVVPEKDYVGALLAELDYRASLPEWNSRPVQTIYFGGGTPSLFGPQSIVKILEAISERFSYLPGLEVSIEANPGAVHGDDLSGYLAAGINRISFGAQSLNTHTLKTLGRTHAPEDVDNAMMNARRAGFDNINLDLMYGVPGQTITDLEADLAAMVELRPDHISPYGLTIEKGTPFYRGYKRGVLAPPDEETGALMMDKLGSILGGASYIHYEISNFALEDRQARHNLAYWNGDDYLGLGAGAHSFIARHKFSPAADASFMARFRASEKTAALRWSNFALPSKYMKEVTGRGQASSWQDELDLKDLIFEYFFLGLRKIAGVSISEFKNKFGLEVVQCYPSLIRVLTGQGLIKLKDDMLTLTPRGLLLADSVIENFSSPPALDKLELMGQVGSAQLEDASNDLPSAANG